VTLEYTAAYLNRTFFFTNHQNICFPSNSKSREYAPSLPMIEAHKPYAQLYFLTGSGTAMVAFIIYVQIFTKIKN